MAFHVIVDRGKQFKPKPCFGFLENLIQMKKGDTFGEPTFRVTRARAALSQTSIFSEVPKERDSPGRVLRKNSKRAVSDENNNNAASTVGGQNKRRAVLKDITNVYRDSSFKNCEIPAKIPVCKQYNFFLIILINSISHRLKSFFHIFLSIVIRRRIVC